MAFSLLVWFFKLSQFIFIKLITFYFMILSGDILRKMQIITQSFNNFLYVRKTIIFWFKHTGVMISNFKL
jgi:hypothetical protein